MTSKEAMQKLVNDILQFKIACNDVIPLGPTIPNGLRKNLAKKFIRQEHDELMIAIDEDDFIEIIDGCFDLIYVTIGLAIDYGVPMAEGWKVGNDSNLAKIDGRHGPIIRDAEGKIKKPPGWTVPDFAQVILNAQLDHQMMMEIVRVIQKLPGDSPIRKDLEEKVQQMNILLDERTLNVVGIAKMKED